MKKRKQYSIYNLFNLIFFYTTNNYIPNKRMYTMKNDGSINTSEYVLYKKKLKTCNLKLLG